MIRFFTAPRPSVSYIIPWWYLRYRGNTWYHYFKVIFFHFFFSSFVLTNISSFTFPSRSTHTFTQIHVRGCSSVVVCGTPNLVGYGNNNNLRIPFVLAIKFTYYYYYHFCAWRVVSTTPIASATAVLVCIFTCMRPKKPEKIPYMLCGIRWYTRISYINDTMAAA